MRREQDRFLAFTSESAKILCKESGKQTTLKASKQENGVTTHSDNGLVRIPELKLPS